MCENKTLQLAFLISMLLHFAVFLSAPYTGVLPKKQSLSPIRVAYFKAKEEPPKKPVSKIQVLQPLAPETLPEVRKEEIVNPIPLKQPQPAPKQEQIKREEPTVETIRSDSGSRAVIESKGKKFETVVNDEKDSVKKATYIGYYRLVREKIRYYADKNYIKERGANQGEVFLSFVVSSSGELLHIMIVDRRSADDSLLRNIAINSVRDASPFPKFPQGMNQYQITFNIIISFELNR